MMGRVVAPSALDDGTPIEQTTGLLQVLQNHAVDFECLESLTERAMQPPAG